MIWIYSLWSLELASLAPLMTVCVGGCYWKMETDCDCELIFYDYYSSQWGFEVSRRGEEVEE